MSDEDKKSQLRSARASGGLGLLGTKGKGRAKAEAMAGEIDDAYGVGGLGLSGGAGPTGESGAEVVTRAWFPETFLFQPLVVTGLDGMARVSVRVPDRLTTWRVLALAHSRNGYQAGAETRFLGTLPVYVDPVIPKKLRSGDEVRLPIALINTTDKAVSTSLVVTAQGLMLDGGRQNLELPARGSALRFVTAKAGLPTTARVQASLGAQDAVIRMVEVQPTGRPVNRSQSGTLAAPRDLDIERPADADPALGQVQVLVYPGALSILRSELSFAGSRGTTLADDAFSLLLAGQAPALLRKLGDTPRKEDLASFRDLTQLSMQRILRQARVLSLEAAVLLSGPALAHPDNPVLSRLGQRALDHLSREQSPDGTCGGEDGWPLQRLLVATADCALAGASLKRVSLRAQAAFERTIGHVRDPYTAAAILASGAVHGDLAERLRKQVLGGLKARKDGAKVLSVQTGVVRADGQVPSEVEATALAVLALPKEPRTLLADLGAAILAAYSPASGWGDGRANLLCMQAVLALFRDPLPASVAITLQQGERTLARSVLTRDHVREVLVLKAEAGPPGTGPQRFRIEATPPVAGLGFSFTLTDRVPWSRDMRSQGLELQVVPPTGTKVGQPSRLSVRAAAPAGSPLTIVLALPAGVQADSEALKALVSDNTLSSYTLTGEDLTLQVPALAQGKAFKTDIRVIPTLSGTLSSGASALRVSGAEVFEPPAVWTIAAAK